VKNPHSGQTLCRGCGRDPRGSGCAAESRRRGSATPGLQVQPRPAHAPGRGCSTLSRGPRSRRSQSAAPPRVRYRLPCRRWPRVLRATKAAWPGADWLPRAAAPATRRWPTARLRTISAPAGHACANARAGSAATHAPASCATTPPRAARGDRAVTCHKKAECSDCTGAHCEAHGDPFARLLQIHPSMHRGACCVVTARSRFAWAVTSAAASAPIRGGKPGTRPMIRSHGPRRAFSSTGWVGAGPGGGPGAGATMSQHARQARINCVVLECHAKRVADLPRDRRAEPPAPSPHGPRFLCRHRALSRTRPAQSTRLSQVPYRRRSGVGVR